ncbi:uroporphyrinogen-III synthase [Oricola cellulosilytica]|uniref:uroporphyrinogen-III synthase n=1 Tax=Oricola cellulosilytica TaxID=1429082 RepID=UPI001304F2B6|nr:uroporphyrinogen-III synthase [Oricola cellulosilytica]
MNGPGRTSSPPGPSIMAQTGPAILVTRPQPGADSTAARLSAMGYRPLVLPLTEVTPVPPALGPAETAALDGVVVTSGNALRHAPPDLLASLLEKPLFTVGDATMEEARTHGFTDTRSAAGDVDDLVRLLSETQKPFARLLYLCGRRRTGDLDRKLAELGIRTVVAEVYATDKVSYTAHKLNAIFRDQDVVGAIFHSAFSASLFRQYVDTKSVQLTDKLFFFALSNRVARSLSSIPQSCIHVAAVPTEDALLASIAEVFPVVGN